MQEHIFRTYDIRGIVGSEFILKDSYLLGRAIASCFIRKHVGIKAIALAMDNRIHSQEIKNALEQAFLDTGIDVVFIGLCPTPLMYFAQYHLDVQAGIMITASHNPAEYNGIKMVLNKQPFFGKDIIHVHETFLNNDFVHVVDKGIATSYNLLKDYKDFLVKEFSHLKGVTRSLIFDCGNGTASTIIPDLIAALEFYDATVLCADVTQNKATHDADPSVEHNVQDVRKALEKKYEAIGLAFDGDADRMGALAEDGRLVSGDKLLALYAKQILKNNPGAVIVYDGKCSSGLVHMIQKAGGIGHVTKTGHAFIKEAIQQYGALLGGELSCHFAFNDRYFGYDDGIYAALRLIEILELTQKRLVDLVADFPYRVASPELRIECPDGKGLEIVEVAKNYFSLQKDIHISTLDGIRIEKNDGWGLLRSSNTQSVICLRLEAETDTGLADLKRDFMNALSLSYPQEYLERTITW
ncbi:phosphomannomutase/phosphoglucomutase [Candidatus Babeliales bacterium]|nr:phosphomannomutase/phosphoglucomutase [Candidatus Babeliales bacterium]